MLGLAVLGIFTTIVLSGVLAGVIAFGLIDSRFRCLVQADVIERLVDIPARRFLEHVDMEEPEELGPAKSRWWGKRTVHALRHGHPSNLSAVVQLRPNNLFRLSYRQLSAQIANAVVGEVRRKEGDESGNRIYPATLLLMIADNESRGRDRRHVMFASFATTESRALAFVDSIQIELAEAVQRRAGALASIVIGIIFLAILLPNFTALNAFAEGSSDLLRTIGSVFALIFALVLILTLSLAAKIIATLTFRWIDRFASAR